MKTLTLTLLALWCTGLLGCAGNQTALQKEIDRLKTENQKLNSENESCTARLKLQSKPKPKDDIQVTGTKVTPVDKVYLTVQRDGSIVVDGEALNGSPMTAYAFQQGLTFLGGYGNYIVTAAVLLFATSTMISWSYYGDRSIQYLFGDRVIMPYRFLFCLMIFIGATQELEVVWAFGDVALGVMAIPNLIALIALSGVLVRITREYYSKEHIPLR